MVDMLYALLPLLREALGLTYTETALIRSIHQLADATFQIPIGIVAERTGERKLLVLGTAIVGIAFLHRRNLGRRERLPAAKAARQPRGAHGDAA